jgi:hypothetical protein
MSRRPEKIASPEGAPSLKAIQVSAEKIGEAMSEVERGAGREELKWVLEPANFAEAVKMLTGGAYYFFPKAANGNKFPYVYPQIGKFGHRRCRCRFRRHPKSFLN